MAENSAIEWCDHTINFWHGCTKVSPACAHCYAESQDARFYKHQPIENHEGMVVGETPGHWGPHAPRLLRVDAARREAMRYERRAAAEGRRFRVFTNSMADFFEDRRDLDGARLEALDVIRQTPNLDWLILTKRPEMVNRLVWRAMDDLAAQGHGDSPLLHWLLAWHKGNAPANVWLGTTVEDQERADQRILALRQVPARVRFLSCEPMLGPVVIPQDTLDGRCCLTRPGAIHSGIDCPDCPEVTGKPLPRIHWVICGGESGPHARPMHPDWARSLRDQCAAAGVPFLFKQWGEWAPYVNEAHYTHGGAERHAHAWIERDGTEGACWIVDDDGSWSNWTGVPTEDAAVMGRHGKKAAGRLLDGVEHLAFPEVG
ncbi:phage Gp37/Gp68 family protein [bacterium]|nr:phage Gp37/Gp68 family protein [bacterium]